MANEQSEVYKGFSHTFWAFCKADMSQTLSNMPCEADESEALEMFHLILAYAGLMQQTKNDDIYSNKEEEDHVFLIQSVLEKAMKKDCLINELFLQLIKQTTDHPEPNSRVNLRHWSLVALACSVILPIDKVVRKYLLAHLKKCSADFVTEEGKYSRFAEKVMNLKMILINDVVALFVFSATIRRWAREGGNGRHQSRRFSALSTVDQSTLDFTSWMVSSTLSNSTQVPQQLKS